MFMISLYTWFKQLMKQREKFIVRTSIGKVYFDIHKFTFLIIRTMCEYV